MELRDYPRVLAKHWLGILVILGLVVGGVALYTYLQPRIFTATSQVFVSISTRVTAGATGTTTVGSSTPYILQRLTSYVEIVDSPLVLQPVIDELGLDTTPQALAGSVSALNPSGTVILEISVTSLSPSEAAEIANAVAEQLSVVIQDLESQTAGSQVTVVVKATLTQPAQPPASPSSPRTRVNLALGAIIGLLLGIAYAFIRNYLDNTVKTQEELAEIAGASGLGMVMFDPTAREQPLVTMDRKSIRAEAFRMVRTNLRYVNVDNRPKVITVTSAVPGEGKSTTAINLAITFGQAGQRVCLVEADLRRPNLGRYLGIDMNVGLTDVLAGSVPLESAILPWNRGMVAVLPSGRTPPNPSELLGSRQMKDVLSKLRSSYDIVIVDAPPLLPVTDGAVVANASDGAILIARWGRTTREQLVSARQTLLQADARILGTIMNFVPSSRGRYGYRYNYGYGYGYGRGYGDVPGVPASELDSTTVAQK
ncbi:MAG: tyrosine-protein kinase domain-containing protein [Candidatus Nanopelagicales bacterium]